MNGTKLVSRRKVSRKDEQSKVPRAAMQMLKTKTNNGVSLEKDEVLSRAAATVTGFFERTVAAREIEGESRRLLPFLPSIRSLTTAQPTLVLVHITAYATTGQAVSTSRILIRSSIRDLH